MESDTEHKSRRDFVSAFTGLAVSGAAAGVLASASARAHSTPNSLHVNVKDFGAVGNWNDASDQDTDAIEAAIAAANIAKRRVYVPAGRYRLTRPLIMPSDMVLDGESEYGAILEQVNAVPMFVNAAGISDFARTRISNITLRGGTYAHEYVLSGTQVQSLGEWFRVRFEHQTVRAIQCSQYFLINNFYNCTFHYCGGAIEVRKNANLNNFIACRFEGLSGNTIAFLTPPGARGGECNSFIGCRFEARGVPEVDTGNTVFILEASTNTLIESSYFEETWAQILYETGSTNTTTFRNNKFSGQETNISPPGAKSEVFRSDGMVTFDSNYFGVGSSTQSTCAVHPVGRNQGLNTKYQRIHRESSTSDSGHVLTKPWSATNGVPVNLFSAARSDLTADPSNCSGITGTICLSVNGLDTNGVPIFINKTFPFVITAVANATMAANFGAPIVAENNAPAATLLVSVGSASASSIVIRATLGGLLLFANARASIKWEISTNPSYPAPVVTLLQ